jgi:hypothetical protein
MILLSPPHRRTKPVVPDIEGHDSAASVMPWSTRRWPTRQVEPEESGNIRQGRERALAEAIRASGNPRINDWGRHNDPVLICGCGYLHAAGARVVAEDQADAPRLMWTWARASAPELRWDDTERKGRVKRLLGDRISNVRSIDAPIDEAKILHRRWRRHVAESDAFLARWARQTAGRLDRVLVIGSEYVVNTRRHRDIRLRKRRDPKASKKWPRFDPTTLTPDGYKRWEAERFLDRALAHHNYADECPRADISKVDRHGSDGGWARNVGTRTADTILARKNALERVEDDIDSRLLHGDDVATVSQFETERLIELADEAISATGIPEIVPVIQHLTGGGKDEHLQTALTRVAKAAGFTTDYTRCMIADGLVPVREALRPWSNGRSGGWVGVPVAENPDRVAVRRLFQDAARAEPTAGRKPAADPKVVFWALELADMIAGRLSARVVAGLAGATREPVPGWVIAGELYLTAGALVMALQDWADDTGNPHGAPLPGAPSLPEVIAIVRAVRPGGRGLQTATRAVAALAYGVPPEALNAMVKKARA